MSSFPGCPYTDQLLSPVSALSGEKEFIPLTIDTANTRGDSVLPADTAAPRMRQFLSYCSLTLHKRTFLQHRVGRRVSVSIRVDKA